MLRLIKKYNLKNAFLCLNLYDEPNPLEEETVIFLCDNIRRSVDGGRK